MSRSDVAGAGNATDDALAKALSDMAAGRAGVGERNLIEAITPLCEFLARRYAKANRDSGLEVEDLAAEGQLVILALARRLAEQGHGWPTDLPRVAVERYCRREMQRACDRARRDWAGSATQQQRRRSAGTDRPPAPVSLDLLVRVPAA